MSWPARWTLCRVGDHCSPRQPRRWLGGRSALPEAGLCHVVTPESSLRPWLGLPPLAELWPDAFSLFSLFLERVKVSPTSRPLHQPSPLLFPWMSTWVSPLLLLVCPNATSSQRPALISCSGMAATPPPPSSFCHFFPGPFYFMHCLPPAQTVTAVGREALAAPTAGVVHAQPGGCFCHPRLRECVGGPGRGHMLGLAGSCPLGTSVLRPLLPAGGGEPGSACGCR